MNAINVVIYLYIQIGTVVASNVVFIKSSSCVEPVECLVELTILPILSNGLVDLRLPNKKHQKPHSTSTKHVICYRKQNLSVILKLFGNPKKNILAKNQSQPHVLRQLAAFQNTKSFLVGGFNYGITSQGKWYHLPR